MVPSQHSEEMTGKIHHENPRNMMFAVFDVCCVFGVKLFSVSGLTTDT